MMKSIDLSVRMQAVADMVRRGSRVCDIGCDHAFVSIYLAANGISPEVIASDVRTGPCDIARGNISAWGVEDKVKLRLGDGLDTIRPGEADAIIIAGMGGMLMTGILERGMAVAESVRQLVLQPQSDTEHVRRFIHAHGWSITTERVLADAGKYYVVLDVSCVPDGGHIAYDNEIYYKYGYFPIVQGCGVLKEYLEKRRITLRGIADGLLAAGTEPAARRLGELEEELCHIDEALELMGR